MFFADQGVMGRAKEVELVCLDFDGTLTDGMVYVDETGCETVRCSRRDSLGIEMLKAAGIAVFVISKETNPVVAARCKKMNVRCEQGVASGEDKAVILRRLAEGVGVKLEAIAYMGDDVNDIAALQLVGLAVAPADAHPKVRKVAHHLTEARGGNHAVRELCDLILEAQGKSSDM
jgi:N-acylneuraminate cytidylyltransferase